MTNETNTGGPAFPSTMQMGDDMQWHHGGMTLRDYFAAKAMAAFVGAALSHSHNEQVIIEDRAKKNRLTFEQYAAKHAWKFADAMLAEREKHNG